MLDNFRSLKKTGVSYLEPGGALTFFLNGNAQINGSLSVCLEKGAHALRFGSKCLPLTKIENKENMVSLSLPEKKIDMPFSLEKVDRHFFITAPNSQDGLIRFTAPQHGELQVHPEGSTILEEVDEDTKKIRSDYIIFFPDHSECVFSDSNQKIRIKRRNYEFKVQWW